MILSIIPFLIINCNKKCNQRPITCQINDRKPNIPARFRCQWKVKSRQNCCKIVTKLIIEKQIFERNFIARGRLKLDVEEKVKSVQYKYAKQKNRWSVRFHRGHEYETKSSENRTRETEYEKTQTREGTVNAGKLSTWWWRDGKKKRFELVECVGGTKRVAKFRTKEWIWIIPAPRTENVSNESLRKTWKL